MAPTDASLINLAQTLDRLSIFSEKDKRFKDKSDRATFDGVLDDRTTIILRSLLTLGHVSDIHGVISTGKEANVYGAVEIPTEGGRPIYRALKIFKTRILSFKDRERYISGEHRFDKKGSQHGYGMVQLWAQKEFRNLQRLHKAGIPCPEPIHLSGHTFIMEFLGRKDLAYPRLVQVELEGDDVGQQWTELFIQVLGCMRRMFHVCKLVHGDLSEYNLLYNDKTLYVIDVSQSVEQGHPNALAFLRSDIKNVVTFFNRQGADTLPDRTIYGFIASKKASVELQGMRAEIDELYKNRVSVSKAEEEIDTQVFRNQHIPQTMQEMNDDSTFAPDDPLIKHLVGKKAEVDDQVSDSSSKDARSSSGSQSDSSDQDESAFDPKVPRGHRFEDREEKKERKRAVKEAKRERRLTKMPKKEKKKQVEARSRRHA